MKRIAMATAAALVAAGSLASPAAAQTYGQHNGQNNNRGDRDNNGRGDRNDRGDSRNENRGDRSDRNDRDDRRGDRNDNRRDSRWNNQRHNGYTYNGRWYYGAPPAAYEGRNGYQAGYRAWRRGDRLPSYYQQRYRSVDYRREHLRAPPRGYRYVEDDRGDMLLVGIATGVILSIILSQ